MAKIISRAEGKVEVPGIPIAFFQFTVRSLEELETAFGASYLDDIVKGMAQMRISVYRAVVRSTVQGVSPEDFPFFPDGPKWEELNVALLDALYLAVRGQTYQEFLDAEQESAKKQMKDRLKEIESDPLLAGLLQNLSSEQSGEQASEAD